MASETLVTPAGEVLFANVLRPKTINKGKEDEKLQYGIVLLQAETDPVAKTFLGKLHKEFMDTFGGNATYGANGKPWKLEKVTDEYGAESSTGIIRVTFNRDTMTRNGQDLPPPMVQDAKGNPWPSKVAIGNGSICKIAFSTYIWPKNGVVTQAGRGISLNLLAVRVLSHVPYNPAAVDPGVFGAPEEGTDATTLAPAAADPFGLDAADGTASTEEVPW